MENNPNILLYELIECRSFAAFITKLCDFQVSIKDLNSSILLLRAQLKINRELYDNEEKK